MHRFFLTPELFSQPEIVFPPDAARQIRSVLRLRVGQRVIVLDNRGSEYEVDLVQVGPDVRGAVIEKRAAIGEPAHRVALYLGLTQREKFEWMLQKCTEVGAAAFIPVITSRALVQDPRDTEKKLERWQRILQEAAEQSGRGLIPELRPVLRFEQAVRQARQSSRLALIPWEGETNLTLRACLTEGLPPTAHLSLFIGPEGGFSEEEIAVARLEGLRPITLGRRILRMETAAVVATALLLHDLDEM
jgi:16S rRNA (uracil1498-N3)-methyltransferase